MKRLLSIFVLCLYTISMSGLWVNVHTCDGEPESIQVFTETSDCCCLDSYGVMEECCEDELVFLQFSETGPVLFSQNKITTLFNYSILPQLVVQTIFMDEKAKTVTPLLELEFPEKRVLYLENSSLLYYS